MFNSVTEIPQSLQIFSLTVSNEILKPEHVMNVGERVLFYVKLEVLGPSGPRLLAEGPSGLLTTSSQAVLPTQKNWTILTIYDLFLLTILTICWPLSTIFYYFLQFLTILDNYWQNLDHFQPFLLFLTIFVIFDHFCHFWLFFTISKWSINGKSKPF